MQHETLRAQTIRIYHGVKNVWIGDRPESFALCALINSVRAAPFFGRIVPTRLLAAGNRARIVSL